MPIARVFFLVICFTAFTVSRVAAQNIKDFQTWTNIGFSKPVDNKTDVAFKYILGMQDNSRQFARSMFSLQIDRKIVKWLKLGLEYRYATQYDIDFHRFWFYATVKKQLAKKWDIAWRPLYQTDVEHFDQEYRNTFPDWPVVRNMITIKYNYNKKLEFYGYVDPYIKLKNHEPLFYRFRYGAGFDYIYKKRLDLGLEFVIMNEFNVSNPFSYSFANIKCIYELPKWNKLKKKIGF